MARMIIAAPPAVGSEAIIEPTNGPLRSTISDAATTMPAVIAIMSSNIDQKMLIRRCRDGAPAT